MNGRFLFYSEKNRNLMLKPLKWAAINWESETWYWKFYCNFTPISRHTIENYCANFNLHSNSFKLFDQAYIQSSSADRDVIIFNRKLEFDTDLIWLLEIVQMDRSSIVCNRITVLCEIIIEHRRLNKFAHCTVFRIAFCSNENRINLLWKIVREKYFLWIIIFQYGFAFK